jgi:hypothetical protein
LRRGGLPKDDLVALILAQTEQLAAQAVQIETLLARIAMLEAKLGQPPKTPENSSLQNSSLPPSKGEKPNRPGGELEPPAPGLTHPTEIRRGTGCSCSYHVPPRLAVPQCRHVRGERASGLPPDARSRGRS